MEFDMKKKLIIATAIVMILAICTTLLVGCDEIFKKNDKRDALQVVATVNYNGQSADVYKFELATTFNNYAYMYVNYYGMTYEAAANYLAQSLAQQRLLTLLPKNRWQNSKAWIPSPKTSRICSPTARKTRLLKTPTRACSRL